MEAKQRELNEKQGELDAKEFVLIEKEREIEKAKTELEQRNSEIEALKRLLEEQKSLFNNEEETKETLKVLNSGVINISEFLLPIENSKRTILSIKRNNEIPNTYPRSYDKIVKKPLKITSK